MTPERWLEVKEALSAALALTGHERAAYLRMLTSRDAGMAREVESLLAHDTEEHFLEQPAVPLPASITDTVFGPYRLQSALGEGGMGVVYLAQDATLERPVALKFLSRELEQQDDARRRFLREAKAAAALDHPYICKIYQTGERDGRPFIAMEYVRGETVRRRLDSGALPIAEAIRITLEVTEALEAAHAAQIVHRDLKPSNIMLTADGHVKVLDFGLAKRVDAEAAEYARTGSAITETGTVRGTVAYMSPEQVRGRDVDVRSDLFSVGVVLYECLAGRNPFIAGSALETASQILHLAPPPLSETDPGVPRALSEIVQRLLAKDPDERHPSATDLRRDLARVRDLIERGQGNLSVPAAAPPMAGTTRRRIVLGRGGLGAAAAAVVLLAAGLTWWFRPAATPRSVAVLPFALVGDDAGNAHLASGIPSALITRLYRAGVRVIGWDTARRFRDSSNVIDVARELNVDTVLSGTFQAVGPGQLQLRVSLNDGAGGHLTWEFEHTGDLFDAYTQIARGVAAELGYELTGDAAIVIARPESSSRGAYNLYLQGAGYLDAGDAEGAGIALEWFRKATDTDPNLVEAHVGIGAVHLERYWNGWGGGAGNLTLAEQRFETARKLDQRDMRAWRGQMLIEFYRGRGEEALRLARQAASVGGGDVETLLARAEAYAINGPSDLAVPLVEQALVLDPNNETAAWLKTIALHRTDLFDETADAAADYTRRFGDHSFVAVLGASMLERLGDLTGARARYERTVGRLMQLPAEPGAATAYDLVALLAAGVFHLHHFGEQDRAAALWTHGLGLTRAALEVDPESVGMRLFLASFLGCLGHPDFVREADSAIALADAARLNPWELVYLVGAYAQRGENDRAFALLHQILDRGRLTGGTWMTVLAPSLRGAPGYKELLGTYYAEEERRRRLFGPSAATALKTTGR